MQGLVHRTIVLSIRFVIMNNLSTSKIVLRIKWVNPHYFEYNRNVKKCIHLTGNIIKLLVIQVLLLICPTMIQLKGRIRWFMNSCKKCLFYFKNVVDRTIEVAKVSQIKTIFHILCNFFFYFNNINCSNGIFKNNYK